LGRLVAWAFRGDWNVIATERIEEEIAGRVTEREILYNGREILWGGEGRGVEGVERKRGRGGERDRNREVGI
jgi:hypothetical protein